MKIKTFVVLPLILAILIVGGVVAVATQSDNYSMLGTQGLANVIDAMPFASASDIASCTLVSNKSTVEKGKNFKLTWTSKGGDKARLINNKGYKKFYDVDLNGSKTITTSQKKIGDVTYRFRVFDAAGDSRSCKKTISITKPAAVAAALDCTFNGTSVPDGDSVTAYGTTSVPYGSTCTSEQRLCNNGVLAGTYTSQKCVVEAPRKCTFKGKEYDNGSKLTRYTQKMAAPEGTCADVQKEFICKDGSFDTAIDTSYKSCKPYPASCTYKSKKIIHGDTIELFDSQQVYKPSKCSSVAHTYTCVDGTLSSEDLSSKFSSCTSIEVPKADKPNVLFIMLDDAGYADYAGKNALTPNINAFASESKRFEQFYTNPMCTPTRMSMLSGNYAMKYGISWVCGSNAVYGIPKTNQTLPEALSSFGYTTASYGKWHAGLGRDQYKISAKFDQWAQTQGIIEKGYFNPSYNDNGAHKSYGGHVSSTTAQYVINKIKESSSEKKPFFINYWLNAPHNPYQPTLKWAKYYLKNAKDKNVQVANLTKKTYFKNGKDNTDGIADKWKQAKYKPVLYKALIRTADDQVQRVLEEIDSDPYLKKNTIVMLVSDNGGTEGAHPKGNVPLRGYKTDVFEGGTRLPLLVRWPDVVEAGVTDTSVVSAEDIFPTIVDLVGGSVPQNVAGGSFAPIILGTQSNVTRKNPLFRAHKVRNEHLKEKDSLFDYDLMSYSVRDGKWKLVYEPLDRKKAYLFDMSDCAVAGSSGKSCEENIDDVSKANPKRFENMKQMYRDWLFDTSKISLKVDSQTNNVTKELTANKYFFGGSGGTVAYKDRLAFDVTRLDTTFTARITPTDREDKNRVIARREGSWILRINDANKLELRILGDKTNQTVTGTTVMQLGQTYDVAFSLYAYKSRNSVAKLYMREAIGDTRMNMEIQQEVPPLASNDNTVTLGSGKDGKINMFIGTIEKVKMFRAPLTKSQIEEVSNAVTVEPAVYETNPLVWKPVDEKWIRDPSIYKTSTGSYILSGTRPYFIEYEDIAPKNLIPNKGTAYKSRLYSPDGNRLLQTAGFKEWGKKFFESDDGLIMLASLTTVADFNKDSSESAGKRSTYVFVPKNDKKTKNGFPLAWKMKSNTPLLRGVYNATVDQDVDGSLYLDSNVRQDQALATTCLGVQTISGSLEIGKLKPLLCPGKKVAKKVDFTTWQRDKPLPSEVGHADGGGLFEGNWTYHAPNGKYYMLYSSGDYENPELYGGFVGVCDSALGPCNKVMNSDNTDTRVFLQGVSKNYGRVGRPYPLLSDDGKLTDILFHARKKGASEDSILRCTNFTPTIIEDFAAGGPGCEYDSVGTGTVLGMSISKDDSSGMVAHLLEVAQSVLDLIKRLR